MWHPFGTTGSWRAEPGPRLPEGRDDVTVPDPGQVGTDGVDPLTEASKQVAAQWSGPRGRQRTGTRRAGRRNRGLFRFAARLLGRLRLAPRRLFSRGTRPEAGRGRSGRGPRVPGMGGDDDRSVKRPGTPRAKDAVTGQGGKPAPDDAAARADTDTAGRHGARGGPGTERTQNTGDPQRPAHPTEQGPKRPGGARSGSRTAETGGETPRPANRGGYLRGESPRPTGLKGTFASLRRPARRPGQGKAPPQTPHM